MAFRGALSNLFPVPVGAIIFSAVANSAIFTNYLIANGDAISKTEYGELYSVIGGQFGEDTNTFNLPDLLLYPYIRGSPDINTVPNGASVVTDDTTVTLTTANLPSLSAANFGAGSLGTSTGNINGGAITHGNTNQNAGAVGSAVKADSSNGQFSGTISVNSTNGVVGYSNTATPVTVSITASGGTEFEPQNLGLLPLIRAKNLIPVQGISNTNGALSPPTQGYIL
jgi:microcystin-dependent protein